MADGIRIDELMKVNSSGVVSANDELNFSFTEEEQKEKISDLLSMTEHDWRHKYLRLKDSSEWTYADAKADANNRGRYCKVSYRLFDYRYTFYTGTAKGLYTRPRDNVMRHFAGFENHGFVCLRGFPKESPPGFVTDAITEHRYWSCSGMQGTDYIFPLYLYEENMGKVEKRANLDKGIVAKIATILNLENPVNPVKTTPTPEDIFDYIYGVLHSPEFRQCPGRSVGAADRRLPSGREMAQGPQRPHAHPG